MGRYKSARSKNHKNNTTTRAFPSLNVNPQAESLNSHSKLAAEEKRLNLQKKHLPVEEQPSDQYAGVKIGVFELLSYNNNGSYWLFSYPDDIKKNLIFFRPKTKPTSIKHLKNLIEKDQTKPKQINSYKDVVIAFPYKEGKTISTRQMDLGKLEEWEKKVGNRFRHDLDENLDNVEYLFWYHQIHGTASKEIPDRKGMIYINCLNEKFPPPWLLDFKKEK